VRSEAHAHGRAASGMFNAGWKQAEADGRAATADDAGDPTECAAFLRAWEGKDVFADGNLREPVHYAMCTAESSFGMGKEEADASFASQGERPGDRWAAAWEHRVKRYFLSFGGAGHKDESRSQRKLRLILGGVRRLSAKVGYHVQSAARKHVTAWPLHHARPRSAAGPGPHSRVRDFAHHLDTKRIGEHWNDFLAVVDDVHADGTSAYPAFFTRVEAHHDAMRATFAARRAEHTARAAARAAHETVRSAGLTPDWYRPRGLFRNDACPCTTVATEGGVDRETCLVRCTQSRDCVTSVDKCDPPTTGLASLWQGVQRFVENFEHFHPADVLTAVMGCWSDRPKAMNPFGFQSADAPFLEGQSYADAIDPTKVKYCFPQINPGIDVALPGSTFNFRTWIRAQCAADVPDGTCLCPHYDTEGLFEFDAWYGVIPYFIFARVRNAFLSVQWILTHYLTEGTIIDRLWRNVFDLFFANLFPRWLRHIWGPDADLQPSGAYGWTCIGLHLGSLMWTMWWGYFLYIMYTAFFETTKEFLTEVVKALQYSLKNLPKLPLLPFKIPVGVVRMLRNVGKTKTTRHKA
jgi:hypothetical protein